jgi:hypothetical protein
MYARHGMMWTAPIRTARSYCERRARRSSHSITIRTRRKRNASGPSDRNCRKEGEIMDYGSFYHPILPSSHHPIHPTLTSQTFPNHQLLKSPGSTTHRLSRPTKARRRDGNRALHAPFAGRQLWPFERRSPHRGGDGGSQLSRVDLQSTSIPARCPVFSGRRRIPGAYPHAGGVPAATCVAANVVYDRPNRKSHSGL